MGKILVVDDDFGCRRLTTRVLNIHGYASVSAANGAEALDAMKHEQVDMVLLDLMMPKMDGLTFIRAMRHNPAWASVPVLILSGIADSELVQKTAGTSVQGFLVKSRYTIDELIREVREHLPHPQQNNHVN